MPRLSPLRASFHGLLPVAHGDTVVELVEAQLGVHLVDLALEVGPEVGLDLCDLLEQRHALP